jgi:hypothetical protein
MRGEHWLFRGERLSLYFESAEASSHQPSRHGFSGLEPAGLAERQRWLTP